MIGEFRFIRYEVSEGVATLTLNRPEALNALTFDMMGEVRDALRSIDADRNIRALILTGAGRAFCAGQDLRNRVPAGADVVTAIMDGYFGVFEALRTCRVPVVVAINGIAAGGGFALALTGDILLAARSAKFLQAYGKIGLVPDLGSTYLLPRAIGRSRALRLMMTNEPLTAEVALAWGLISECVEDDALATAARDLAIGLARGPTLALVAARSLVDEGLATSFEGQFRRELEVQREIRTTQDAIEGVAAFVEKRPPRFRGC